MAAEVVGTLRLSAGRFPDDPQLSELVGESTIKSLEFRVWWNGHRVHERTYGTKRMMHSDRQVDHGRWQAAHRNADRPILDTGSMSDPA